MSRRLAPRQRPIHDTVVVWVPSPYVRPAVYATRTVCARYSIPPRVVVVGDSPAVDVRFISRGGQEMIFAAYSEDEVEEAVRAAVLDAIRAHDLLFPPVPPSTVAHAAGATIEEDELPIEALGLAVFAPPTVPAPAVAPEVEPARTDLDELEDWLDGLVEAAK